MARNVNHSFANTAAGVDQSDTNTGTTGGLDFPGRSASPLDEVVAVLQDLNEFVVSLDRLGSRQASGTAEEHTVRTFIADWDVARRLARARRVIGVALDAQLSEEGNAEIDALCDQGRFYGTDSATTTPTDQSS